MADTARRPGRRVARHPAGGAERAVGQARREAGTPQTEEQSQIVDVWSRAATKYRTRAVVLLLVNVLLFGGLCVFAFWLRTGIVFAPAQPQYWQQFAETFQPSRETTVSLGSLLTFPISVEEVPLQVVILGLLLAALASIPIVVSILYRFPASLPFLAGVAFVAMMPWLAITLTGSCILASLRPFRFQFRYASALLGLVLVLAYFYGAARTASTPVDTLANPADRIKFIAPWLLATVASCALMAFVLLIARMVNYRPGAIAPLLAVMFAVPVVLFEFYVGRDELHYRIIEHDFGPGSAHFAERDVSEEFDRAVRAAWMARPTPRPPLELVRDNSELLWSLHLGEALGPYHTAIAKHRHAAVGKIDWFLRYYPDSRYAVNALYLNAMALDTRVNQAAFLREKVLRFHSDFPSESSRLSWQRVYENGPQTPMAAVALGRLSLLDARAGDLDAAVERLATLVRTFGETEAGSEPTGGSIRAVLTPKPVEATLGISVDRNLLEAQRLLALLLNNRDPLYGDEPLIRLLHFDPRSEHYRDNLQRLIRRYPRAQITDNARLEAALAAAELPERIGLLEGCVRDHPAGDAVPEALFRLGEAHRELQNSARARDYYQRVIQEHPNSVWRRLAEDHLRVLSPTPTPTDH